eukprot:TRINITY_DN71620_c0_g1_i1.p1 TRINITY_DN71620_c0_g1~~TRINITY_DN71620_c0_g1_i1.p1  ORF type:complete len:961 (+),score=93.55 TRINITY_DN71620_c0_g1_i1:42-2924(+)
MEHFIFALLPRLLVGIRDGRGASLQQPSSECDLGRSAQILASWNRKELEWQSFDVETLHRILAPCPPSEEKQRLLANEFGHIRHGLDARKALERIEALRVVEAFFADRQLSDDEYCWFVGSPGFRWFRDTAAAFFFANVIPSSSAHLWRLLTPASTRQRECFSDLLQRFSCTGQTSIVEKYASEPEHTYEIFRRRYLHLSDLAHGNLMLPWLDSAFKLQPRLSNTSSHELTQIISDVYTRDSDSLMKVLGAWTKPAQKSLFGSLLLASIKPAMPESSWYALGLKAAHSWACTNFPCHMQESGLVQKLLSINSGRNVALHECATLATFEANENDCRYLFRGFFAQLIELRSFVHSDLDGDTKAERIDMVQYFLVTVLEKPRKTADRLILLRYLMESFLEYEKIQSENGETVRSAKMRAIQDALGLAMPHRMRLSKFGETSGLLTLKPVFPFLVPPMLNAPSLSGEAVLDRLLFLARCVEKESITALRHLLVSLRYVHAIGLGDIGRLLAVLPAPRTVIRLKSSPGVHKCVALQSDEKTFAIYVKDTSSCEALDTELKEADILTGVSAGNQGITKIPKPLLKKMRGSESVAAELNLFTESFEGSDVTLLFSRKAGIPKLHIGNWTHQMTLLALIYFDNSNHMYEAGDLNLPDVVDASVQRALDTLFKQDVFDGVPAPLIASTVASGSWIRHAFFQYLGEDGVATKAAECILAKFRRPELLLSYAKQHVDNTPEVFLLFQMWVKAVGQDCLEDWPPPGQGAINQLKFGQLNQDHLVNLPEKALDAWRNSVLLERDPEILLLIGEAVGSCQSITWGAEYNRGLVSYLAVGHFGVLTDTKVDGGCADSVTERACRALRGRAVIRLLLEDQSPALMLEKPYYNPKEISTSKEEEAVNALLLAKAVRLSDDIGAPLYSEAAGFQPCLTTKTTILVSLGGAAPFTYVDSAGGLKKSSAFAVEVQCRLH